MQGVRCDISSKGYEAGSKANIQYRLQKESSANIKNPPRPYQHGSPPTRQNIIEFDCRGLEFTAFRPDVCEILRCFLRSDLRG